MNKPTCEQLIEQLGNNEDITICSDVVYGLGFEYQQLKNRIDKALSWTNRIIEIIKQQPSEDDTWILENLHSIKCLLQGVIRMNEKYILVGADKDRYQRPVDIYVVKKFDTLKEASSYLMSYVNKCDEMINAINNKIDYVDIGDIWYELEYIDNFLVSYLQSGDDEYCSSSYKIFKITD